MQTSRRSTGINGPAQLSIKRDLTSAVKPYAALCLTFLRFLHQVGAHGCFTSFGFSADNLNLGAFIALDFATDPNESINCVLHLLTKEDAVRSFPAYYKRVSFNFRLERFDTRGRGAVSITVGAYFGGVNLPRVAVAKMPLTKIKPAAGQRND